MPETSLLVTGLGHRSCSPVCILTGLWPYVNSVSQAVITTADNQAVEILEALAALAALEARHLRRALAAVSTLPTPV